MRVDRAPRFVEAILDRRWAGFIARVLLASACLPGGIVKATGWSAAAVQQARLGMTPPAFRAARTPASAIVGPLPIRSVRRVWLGARVPGVLTPLAAVTADAFWTMPAGQERFGATNAVFGHLGLSGGFILAALAGDAEKRCA